MLIATPPSFPWASTPLQLPMPKLARDPGLTHEEADRVTLYLAELADAGRRGGGRCARMVVIGKGRGVSILIIAQAVDPHDYPVVKRGTAQRFLPLGRPAGRCLTHTHLGIATSLSCGPVASPHSVSAARLGSSTMATTQDPTPAGVTHYAPGSVLGPGDRPLCGNESAVYSNDPDQVAGLRGLPGAGLRGPAGPQQIQRPLSALPARRSPPRAASSGAGVVRRPCPHCGRAGR